MTSVDLHNVTVRFPVLHVGHRSLKKNLVSKATGGAILQDARMVPIVEAVKEISFSLRCGDRIGLVGPNGAGKSTLLRIIAGIYEPDEGELRVIGNVLPLLELGIGFDGDLTGYENIRLRGMYLGIKPSRMKNMLHEIAEFSELGAYLDLPVRTYSSGMQMRLSLGIATAIEPNILLMDEWVLAGDAAFLEKSRLRLANFVEKARIMVLASHSETIIREWCNKAILLRNGHLEIFGNVDDVLKKYSEELF